MNFSIDLAKMHCKWLMQHGLTYHFDDHPDDIRWSRPLTPAERVKVDRGHEQLHALPKGPWSVFEGDDRLWNQWCGRAPNDNGETE